MRGLGPSFPGSGRLTCESQDFAKRKLFGLARLYSLYDFLDGRNLVDYLAR